jgi:hypothetical protein
MVLTEAPILHRSEEASRTREKKLLAMSDSPRQINQGLIQEALTALTPLEPGSKGEILNSADDLDTVSKMSPRQAEMTLHVLGTQSLKMQDILVNVSGKTTIVFERPELEDHEK